jgi:flavin-dependent dehydrogenase
VVTDGFIGLGDAVAPAGYLGILPAIFLGRQAALIAAEALDEGDPSEQNLAPYDQLYHALVVPALQAEAKATVALLEMTDDELDRLAELLNWLHLPIPFLGYKHSVDWNHLHDLVRQFPLAACDWDLLMRVLSEPGGPAAMPAIAPAMPVPCDTPVAMS